MIRNLIWLILPLALLAACAEEDLTTSPETPLAVQATWPVIREGDSGQTVRTAQYLLRHRGQSLSVDAQFGPGTAGAVRNFQSANSLPVDGIVGPNNWSALSETVRQGDVSDAVRAVQSELGVTVDGDFGPNTAQAVRNFQSANGLTVDGIVGPNTWTTLVGGSGSNPGGGTDRASLAQRILEGGRVELLPYSPINSGSSDGADARSNIRDTAAGGAAQRSCYGNAPCGSVNLDTRMLSGMLSVANSYSVRVTSIAGGSHSATSRHYAGISFDVDIINGQGVSSSNPYSDNVMQRCRDAGATEVLGPGDGGHSGHVHCAWSR